MQPVGIEPTSTVLHTAAMTTSAKVAYKIGRLTILVLISLVRLSRIGKFILPYQSYYSVITVNPTVTRLTGTQTYRLSPKYINTKCIMIQF